MGKFVRLCSNALHNTWFKGYSRDVELIVPNKRYLQAFKKVAKQYDQKPHGVRLVCKRCVEKAEKKRDFTWFLSYNDTPCSANEEVTICSSILYFVF